MSSRRRKTQKAGYKYLRNTARAAWVETLVPYGNQIISQIPNIQWDSFEYKGPVEINLDRSLNNSSPAVREIVEAIVTPVAKPYSVFGGAACEMWGSVIPKPNIRDFVDPTGDIDVLVSLPKVSVQKEYTGEYDDVSYYLVNPEGKLTQLGDEFTKWLYSEVVRVYSPLATFFNRPEFSLPDRSEDNETNQADIVTAFGNLLFTRAVIPSIGNIKIQISTKVTTRNATTVDHLIEFLLVTGGQSYSPDVYTVKGVLVPSPWALFTQQIKGLTDRATKILPFWEKYPDFAGKVNDIKVFYKVDNHCARLLYLAYLQKEVEGKPWPSAESPEKYFQMINLETIVKTLRPLFSNKSIPFCYYHFADYRKTLLSILDTFERVSPKGVLTKPSYPLSKEFNRMLSKGGKRKGLLKRKTTLKKR